MECISYKKGYKYQLYQAHVIETGIVPALPVNTTFIGLSKEGQLTIKMGYAWDGPSGPAIDTRNFMRGSLVHDALYQLLREGHLKGDAVRKDADRLLRKICKEDGMTSLRAWWVYMGVRIGAGPAADPSKDKPLTKAPKGCS